MADAMLSKQATPHEPAPARVHAHFDSHLCHAWTAGCMMQPGCSEYEGICCFERRRTWVHRTRRVRLRMAPRLSRGHTPVPRHVHCGLILMQPADLLFAQLHATHYPCMCRKTQVRVRRHRLCAIPSALCLSRVTCLTDDSVVLQARENPGGFFQDNRKLSIVELDPDRFGPAKWVEE